MLIDTVFAVLMIAAVFKGYSRGLIVAVFSLLAIITGLAAALKLSLVTANWLKDAVHVAARWLPVLAFILVFIVVVLLVRLGAGLLQKATELVLLGWVNRLGGIILYIALYTIMLSVFLFYAEKMHLLQAATISASKTYSFIQPWGPKTINAIGSFIPLFKDMFLQLENFFAGISDKIQPH